MADIRCMAEYNGNTITALKAIPWVAYAGNYPTDNSAHAGKLPTPAVWFRVNGWSAGKNSEESCAVDLSCELFVITDLEAADDENPQIKSEQAAADITAWLMEQVFCSPAAAPPVFQLAKRDADELRLAGYQVWRIVYSQLCKVTAYSAAAGQLSAVWLAQAPDVGNQHLDNYRRVYGSDAHE
ncbi:hypothetical protein BTJ39_12095 [Izhakiella australiensis]|uniref:Phage tail protein n=1 Tax=Izhakiella australiensis TaxID=1926881 RepID=A0A1S8YKZ2_9GAMM|nr:hypothetical protein [Izhakiella australiensis]OON39769.1 hypothetical protein BTJ39_12095 [Izhakiella australiensis]